MTGSRAAVCRFLICLSFTSMLSGAAQETNAFQSILSGLLPADAAAITPFLGMAGPQLLPLPTEAEKEATLCSIIAEKQLPIQPSFCTTPPPAGPSPPPPSLPPAPVPAPTSMPPAPVPVPSPAVPITPAPAPVPIPVPAPEPSCIVNTTYSFTFDSAGPECPTCGQPTFACNTGMNSPTNPPFTDTSPGTFVSLSAILTSVYPGTFDLSINNIVQGSFPAPDGNPAPVCGVTDCSVTELVPAVPQTGYVVGGLNAYAIQPSGTPFVCFTYLVLTVTTSVC